MFVILYYYLSLFVWIVKSKNEFNCDKILSISAACNGQWYSCRWTLVYLGILMILEPSVRMWQIWFRNYMAKMLKPSLGTLERNGSTSTTLESLMGFGAFQFFLINIILGWFILTGFNSYIERAFGDEVAKMRNDAWDLLYQVLDEKVKVIKRD